MLINSFAVDESDKARLRVSAEWLGDPCKFALQLPTPADPSPTGWTSNALLFTNDPALAADAIIRQPDCIPELAALLTNFHGNSFARGVRVHVDEARLVEFVNLTRKPGAADAWAALIAAATDNGSSTSLSQSKSGEEPKSATGDVQAALRSPSGAGTPPSATSPICAGASEEVAVQDKTPTLARLASVPVEAARCTHFANGAHTPELIQMWARILKALDSRDLFITCLENVWKVADRAPYTDYYDKTTEPPPGCNELEAAHLKTAVIEALASTCGRIATGLCPASTPAGLIRLGQYGERLPVVQSEDTMGVWRGVGEGREFVPIVDHVMRQLAVADDGSRIVQLANRHGKQIVELPAGALSNAGTLDRALAKTKMFHVLGAARGYGTHDLRRTLDIATKETSTFVKGTPVWGRTDDGDWVSSSWCFLSGRWVDATNDAAVIAEADRYGRRIVHRKPIGDTVMGAPVFNPRAKLGLDFVAEQLWLSWGPVGILTLAWNLSVLYWHLVRRRYSWFSPMGLFSPTTTGKSSLGEKPSIFCGFNGAAMQWGTQATRPSVSWMTSSTSCLPLRLQEYDPTDRELKSFILNLTGPGGRDKMSRSGASMPESEIYRTSVLFDGQSFEGVAATMNRFAAFKITPQMRERGETGIAAWRKLEPHKDDYLGAVAKVIERLEETTPVFEQHLAGFVEQMKNSNRGALVWAPSLAAFKTYLEPYCDEAEVQKYVGESITEAGAEASKKTIDQRLLDGLEDIAVGFAARGAGADAKFGLTKVMTVNFWAQKDQHHVYVNLKRFIDYWLEGLRLRYRGGDPDEVPGLDVVRKIIATLPGCVGHTKDAKVSLTYCGRSGAGSPCSSDGRSSAHIFRVVDIDPRMRMIFPEGSAPRLGNSFAEP